jgi:Kef-type K+ transport system membrane component KefB
MTFGDLALISAVALLGPALALPRHGRLPLLLGELIAGVALGRTGFGVLHPADPTFTMLADIGFALVMFVAGTHVPVRDARLRQALRIGALRAAAVVALAVPLALAVAALFHTNHPALYAVLLASSSAALVLPIVGALRLAEAPTLQLTAQVAIADAACIVALPLVIDPARAGSAALGAAAVIAAAAALYLGLSRLERSGLRKRAHRVSRQRKFAMELRINLVILFALAALATATHVSIMLAGFCFGLAVSGSGQPRRLAKQVFALTEGFLGPLFFVWLGASLDIRDLGRRPSLILLAAALGAGAIAVHVAMRVTGQPVSLGVLAAGQLGVPVAAATIGAQQHLLEPGEAAALILAELLTIAAVTWAGAHAAGKSASPAADQAR